MVEDQLPDECGPMVGEVAANVWVISDLQTVDPKGVSDYLTTAIDDITAATDGLGQIWYLGDATYGTDLERVERIATRQFDILADLDPSLRYVMGNHDLDYVEETGEFKSPFYELVQSHPDWRTTDSRTDFYFFDEIGDWTVLFLSDHVASDGRWIASHGGVHQESERYPYTQEDYRMVVDQLEATDGPAIIAGHYAFSGGNRPAEIQDWFFPLPENVRLHLYGHAHIGDEEWVGKDAFRTFSYIDDHRIPQVDVASLEDYRGDTVRSALLTLYTSGVVNVSIRDHRRNIWLESYFQHPTAVVPTE